MRQLEEPKGTIGNSASLLTPQKSFPKFRNPRTRVANCTLWFLKPPHIEAKEELIYSVKILGGSSSVLELLETIGNSDKRSW